MPVLFRRRDHRKLKSAVPFSEQVKGFLPAVVVVVLVMAALWVVLRFF